MDHMRTTQTSRPRRFNKVEGLFILLRRAYSLLVIGLWLMVLFYFLTADWSFGLQGSMQQLWSGTLSC